MIKSKKIKALLLGAVLTMVSAQTVQAATYTVSQGDTLYSIGTKYNVSYQTIMSSNNLTTANIYPGQVINIPDKYHIVQSGETLYSIANKYGVTIDAIKRASNEWDNIIYPGQRLVIPTVSSGTSTVNTLSTSTSRPAVISYTASDLDLLARLIRAEAENQSYTAKVGVGAVVVNRVQSSQFPNTIREVIYQRINGYYQFTPVANGYINRAASQEDIKAAYDALHGSDPTNNALFYFDDSTTSQWMWSRPIAYRSGDMVYSY